MMIYCEKCTRAFDMDDPLVSREKTVCPSCGSINTLVIEETLEEALDVEDKDYSLPSHRRRSD